ncbi:hypothetical protein PDE_04558 [Penicillium oxalicum 114-2]|uniref:Uncharacterized protein n=1 Tax=Penicillium oxalicum (strain 114-2 / CGMCC 5302) TaxID=933388 RepID=S8ATY2_PENO1|nr:hypothetical protein PDE_04558 [Penicillium oxalicum 114-2]
MKIDNLEDVIIALLAAHPSLKMAVMYGRGTKCETMEWKFRAWRKEAQKLQATGGESTFQRQPTSRKNLRKPPRPSKRSSFTQKPSSFKRQKSKAKFAGDNNDASLAYLGSNSDTWEDESMSKSSELETENTSSLTSPCVMTEEDIKLQIISDDESKDEVVFLSQRPAKEVKLERQDVDKAKPVRATEDVESKSWGFLFDWPTGTENANSRDDLEFDADAFKIFMERVQISKESNHFDSFLEPGLLNGHSKQI